MVDQGCEEAARAAGALGHSDAVSGVAELLSDEDLEANAKDIIDAADKYGIVGSPTLPKECSFLFR